MTPGGPSHDERRWLLRNPILWVVYPLVAVALGAAWMDPEARPVTVLPAMFLALLLAGNLHIRVEDRQLRLTYFPLWRRTIPLADVVRAEVVPYKWWRYGGWGIRIGLDGSLSYSVWETHAVRLDIKGKRSVNVGSGRPEDLLRAIEAARG